MLKVYICEKPSQGKDIASFLGMGATNKKNGHYRKGNVAVTWGFGHIFKLQPPDFYLDKNVANKAWSFDQLPIIPAELDFKYTLNDKCKSQFNIIKGLVNQAECVFIATDPDPEGEAIARTILKFTRYKGQIKRVLYGSNDTKTLTLAFDNPLEINETDWMYHQQLARSFADWLIGMNFTRAVSIISQKMIRGTRKKAFNVGRVKTPMCMLVFNREKAIINFKPQNYYEIKVHFFTEDKKQFSAKLDVPVKFLKDDKLLDLEIATKLKNYLLEQGKGVVKKSDVTRKTKAPPLPHDLPSLEAVCGRFNIEPDEVLDIAQSLYAQPLAATHYPRTDTRYLPKGLYDDALKTVKNLQEIDCFKSFEINLSKVTKCWNDSKVKVHHAIIPNTKKVELSRLTKNQKIVYLILSSRLLAQFMNDHTYDETKYSVQIGNFFTSKTLKKVVDEGWRNINKIEGGNTNSQSDDEIDLKLNQLVGISKVEIIKKVTKAPPRYTPTSLSSALGNIAKEIDDPELSKLLDEQDGIGTPATRSTAIKETIKAGLIDKKSGYLYVSEIFKSIEPLLPPQLKQPHLSALWERGFASIKRGDITVAHFVNLQADYVNKVCKKLEKINSEIR